MSKRQDIINLNEITNLCKKYRIKWHVPRKPIGVYIYYDDNNYKYFPLWRVLDAYDLILKIANIDSSDQDTLN